MPVGRFHARRFQCYLSSFCIHGYSRSHFGLKDVFGCTMHEHEHDDFGCNERLCGDHIDLTKYTLDSKRESTLCCVPGYHITNKFWYRDLAMHRTNCGRLKPLKVSWSCFRCCAHTGVRKALASLARNCELYCICINFLDIWITVARFFFMPRTYKDHLQSITPNDSLSMNIGVFNTHVVFTIIKISR